MFFAEQTFEGLELGDYVKKDTRIPKTNIFIYQFECAGTEKTGGDEEKAKQLDQLTIQLEAKFPGRFQIINSESSQFFCQQLYPMVVSFETKLRYALYISEALFQNGNVNRESFLLEVDKKKKSFEETDFGGLYEAVFTDKNMRNAILKEYTSNLTKVDLIKIIARMEEKTMWHDLVGADYSYIEQHFLEIKEYRNDVMHSHLMSYAKFNKAKAVLKKAIDELNRAICDKLIVNKSDYLNAVDIVATLGKALEAIGRASTALAIDKTNLRPQAEALLRFLGDVEPIQDAVEKEEVNYSNQKGQNDNV